jgi:uncharacterized caspase-like protein
LSCSQHRHPNTFFAFIVGNDAYPSQPLVKCVNDAKDVEEALLAGGYLRENVVSVLDGTRQDIAEALARFTKRLDGARGSRVAFFFSGHGVEGAGGENIFMPVDAINAAGRRKCISTVGPTAQACVL